MNRLSDLQTIVRVANICNKYGLAKEADQLLNIFTKLAQENLDNTENVDVDMSPMTNSEETNLENKTPNELATQEQVTEVTPDDTKQIDKLMKDINEYWSLTTSFFDNLKNASEIQDIINLKSHIDNLIELSSAITNNPKVDEENKKNVTENLQPILEIKNLI
jgi:hypothetical protein